MAKILIVEDDTLLNKAYEAILKKENHTIKVAFDGEEGLALAGSFNPQIILLDLLMPKKNGLEFLRDYKAKEKHPDVKIIILSNLDMDKEIEEAMELGAYKYILKVSSSPQQLASLVNHLIKSNLVKEEVA